MTTGAGPSAAEPSSMADLAADAAEVERLLDLGSATVERPAKSRSVSASSEIPDSAYALVADLDRFGD